MLDVNVGFRVDEGSRIQYRGIVVGTSVEWNAV
jgi:hypothetical protein